MSHFVSTVRMSGYPWECGLCKQSIMTSEVMKCKDCSLIFGSDCCGGKREQEKRWNDGGLLFPYGLCDKCYNNDLVSQKGLSNKKRTLDDGEEQRKRQCEFDESRRECGKLPPRLVNIVNVIRAQLPHLKLSDMIGHEEEWQTFKYRILFDIDQIRNKFEREFNKLFEEDELCETYIADIIKLERKTLPESTSKQDWVQDVNNWIWCNNDIECPLNHDVAGDNQFICVGCNQMDESIEDSDLCMQCYGSRDPMWRLKGTMMCFCRFCYEKVNDGRHIELKYAYTIVKTD